MKKTLIFVGILATLALLSSCGNKSQNHETAGGEAIAQNGTPINIDKPAQPEPQQTRSRGIEDDAQYLLVVLSTSSKQAAIEQAANFTDGCEPEVWESIVNDKVVYRAAYGFQTRAEATNFGKQLKEFYGDDFKCWPVARTETDIKVWQMDYE